METFCDCCGNSKRVRWYLYDENAEVELCIPCVKAIRENGETCERIAL